MKEPDYNIRRGELSAYGRASDSATALYKLVLGLVTAVLVLSIIALLLDRPGGSDVLVLILLLLSFCSLCGITALWLYARKNFIEPDLAFRKWLQQVCDGDLDAQIDLPANHAHYKELHFHTGNLAASLNRLSTDMENLVDSQTKRLESQNKSLDLLYKLTADVSRETDRRAVLETVCRYLADWFDLAQVSAYMQGDSPSQSLSFRYDEANGSHDLSLHTWPDMTTTLVFSAQPDNPARCIIQVPIFNGTQVSGMLVIETAQPEAAEQKSVERVLTAISEQLSLFAAKQSTLEQNRTAQMVRDRNALAADIHDSLAQTLAALRYQVVLLQEALESKSAPELGVDIERIKGTVSEANQEVRGLIQEFRHPLSQQRSADDIRATVEAFRDHSGRQVFFQTDDPHLSFTPREESQLQRIIGEALNNAKKYSQASMVRVYLRCDGLGVRRVLVEDDGIGFSDKLATADDAYDGNSDGTRIGLTIMQERASSVGATLTIETEPGEGTRIAIELPPHDKFAGE